MKWPAKAIGAVCSVVSGATPKTGKSEFWDGDVPWVTPKDISDLGAKHLCDTPRKITAAGLRSCSATMLPAQSVLFSSRAPIGLVAINAIPVCTNQGFKSLVPRDGLVSADYLYWWLRVHRDAIQRMGRGATFKEVSKKIVERIEIPLPPLAEQKRIAAILDAADALRQKRRESLAQLDTLVQSVFLDMFGDPGSNPMGWQTLGLESFCRPRQWPTIKKTELVNDGYPVFGANGRIGFYSEYNHAEPTVLITCRGATCGSINVCDPKSYVTGNAMALDDLDQNRVERRFLEHALAVSDFSAVITGVAQPQITRQSLARLLVPAPPLDLQRRFAIIVESVEQQKASQRAHLAELDSLFASLQSRAFRSEL